MSRAKKKGRKPTLKDVAFLAGVSPMTASRVVSGSQGVSPELARKVQNAVQQLGYSRNEAARLMRPGQRSGLLGVIITNIDNPYYAQVLLGIESVAHREGRLIITGISHNNPKLEADLVDDLIARQIEGLIVVPASANAPHLTAVAASGMTLVLASRGINQSGVDTVLVDDVSSVRQIVEDTLRAGHYPMAFIGGPDTITTASNRLLGFEKAHKDAGLTPDDHMIQRIPAEPECVTDAVHSLLDLPEPPQAFFTTNNRYTVSVLKVLLRESYRWPEGARRPPLVGFDSFELAESMPYPLTLIEHDAHALGRIAADLALRRINHEDATPPMTITLPSSGLVVANGD